MWLLFNLPVAGFKTIAHGCGMPEQLTVARTLMLCRYVLAGAWQKNAGGHVAFCHGTEEQSSPGHGAAHAVLAEAIAGIGISAGQRTRSPC